MRTLTLPFRSTHSRLRRRLGAGGAVAVWLVGASALVAAAAILLLMRITGSIDVVAGPTLTYEQSATTAGVPDGSGLTCNQSISTDRKSLTVTVTNALPGASCEFQTAVASTRAGLVVQNLDLGPAVAVTKSTATAICGASINSGSFTLLKWRLAIPETASAGTVSIPSTAGVTVVPAAQYDASACKVG